MAEGPKPSVIPSSSLFVYTENVDAMYKRALDAGARADMPVENMFWGDRYGRVVDPFGQPWSIATHTRDLTPEEVKQGMFECFAKAPAKV